MHNLPQTMGCEILRTRDAAHSEIPLQIRHNSRRKTVSLVECQSGDILVNSQPGKELVNVMPHLTGICLSQHFRQ